MDPHTARCLQLSTSIRMPFHHYRTMDRSRFPVNPQAANGRQTSQRGAGLSANAWPSPLTPNSAYQPYTPTTPINGCGPLNYQLSPAHGPGLAKATVQENPFFSPAVSNYSTDAWDSLKQKGLGMSFLDQDGDFGPITFSATTENFDDLIRINEKDSWDNRDPMSPDRRSLSSASSGDAVSDFADASDYFTVSTMGSDTCSSLEMPTVEEDAASIFTPGRRGRSSSRAPASRSSSVRRFRRSPYSVDHARSSSVISTSSNSVSLPNTQCCSPVEEYQSDFLLEDFQATEASTKFIDQTALAGAMFGPETQTLDGFYQNDPLSVHSSQLNDCLFLSTSVEEAIFAGTAAPILPSSVSAAEQRAVSRTCENAAELSEEPDLFGALLEEQSVPPEEDMKPQDSDLEPSEQELRFEGDLYTPRFVRGHGNKREGYCGLCKPGRWLVLKNSAFWYDKSFTHGISAATGQPFDAPKETRRMSGNPDMWEGLCGTCDDWIALISNKKKGTTWFRHAYKCHNHQKAKDAPKRRRDGSQSKPAKSKEVKSEETEYFSESRVLLVKNPTASEGPSVQPF